MKESTNIFDKNGDEIFIGDVVEKRWGLWKKDGKMVDDIRSHVIKKVVEGNTISYCLGESRNFWVGQDVTLKK